MRELSYAQAINEALGQILDYDKKAFLIGQGVESPWHIGNTTNGLFERFGSKRIIDTPISENGITGVAIGAALSGLHPILVYSRMDFMYLALDQIANHAATWHFMFGGRTSVPLTIWAIINRGGEQAAQHSQALQSIFMHIPGIKIVAPSSPYDAKGLFAASVYEENPVIYVDDRWLYNFVGDVPEELYSIPIGRGKIKRFGRDITVVASSYLVNEALVAAEICKTKGIDVEVIDLRTLKPLDESLIFTSINKTERIIIVDGCWKTCGIAAEISARISDNDLSKNLRSPIKRISLPDIPAPSCSALEEIYYINYTNIVSSIKQCMTL